MNTTMFATCCAFPKRIQYSILHDPVPMTFSDETLTILEYLLWYVPGISSEQSHEEEFLNESRYNEHLFSYVMRRMDLSNSDVCWVQEKKIGADLINNYEEAVCTACQKLILTGSTSNKISTLLRHLRNCIAHGRFNILGDKFIGFDKEGKSYTGVIKLQLSSLNTLISILSKKNLRESLIADAFTRLGYQVQMGVQNADMEISKLEERYSIELKRFSYKGQYIINGEFEKYVAEVSANYETDAKINRIVIIDTAVLSNINRRAAENLNIKFIDWQGLQQILLGTDVLQTLD